MTITSEKLSKSFDFRVITSAIGKIQRGMLEGLNHSLRERSQELPENYSREEFESWVSNLDEEARDALRSGFETESRYINLRRRKSRFSYFEDVEIDSTSDSEDVLKSMVAQISTQEAEYYDSHFKFANSSFHLYQIEDIGGVVGEIASNAEGPYHAEEIFIEEVGEREDIDDRYAAAAEWLSPIAGEIESNCLPRFIHFEDKDHIFIEFWSLGKEKEVFDGQRGESLRFRPRIRSAVRIHADSGFVEVFDGKKDKIHRNTIVDRVEKLLNPPSTAADGGTSTAAEEAETTNILKLRTVSEEDIWEIINSIGMLTTLEGFAGRTADARLSAVENRDVRKDETHDDLKEDRPLELANVKLFFDDLNGGCEFINPEAVSDHVDFDQDTTQSDMKEEIAENTDYDNIDHITISLNADSDVNTLRFQKERCKPSARRNVFHLVVECLGW